MTKRGNNPQILIWPTHPRTQLMIITQYRKKIHMGKTSTNQTGWADSNYKYWM